MKIAISRKNIWDNLPITIKNGLGTALSIIPKQHLLGKEYKKNYSFVEKSQWWSSDEIKKYQLIELKKVCIQAYDKTIYYRKKFDGEGFNPHKIKSLDDLHYMPTIDRNDVIENLSSMTALPVNSPSVDHISTGGTGGVPLKFYIGANRSSIEYPYLVSSWKRVGYKIDTPLAVIRGRIVKENNQGIRHEYDPILKHHYYSNFHMSDENIKKYLNHIKTIGPCFLHVYPSSAANLALFIRQNGIIPPNNILGILAESENVYEKQRIMIESVFGCRFFSSYGHTEKLVAATECEKSTNYHIWPTYGFFELLDENNNPIKEPGKRGEIVGTGFINTIVPFIRYRTGDFATYIGNKCQECGRNHLIISNIRGHRIQENLITRDGTLISWTSLNMHDDTFDQVKQFQFFQDTPGEAILKIVPTDLFTNKNKKIILHNIEKKVKDQLKIVIVTVDKVQISNRGKAIFVDQHIVC